MAEILNPPPVIMVTLEMIAGGHKQEFDFDHAKRILEHQRKIKLLAWRLPDDSPYTLENGNFIKRGGLKLDKGAKKSG